MNARSKASEMRENALESKGAARTSRAEDQRWRVLQRLRSGPATTIQLRSEEDVMMPAARIFELRHNSGFKIHMVWVQAFTSAGKKHRVGLYRIVSEPDGLRLFHAR